MNMYVFRKMKPVCAFLFRLAIRILTLGGGYEGGDFRVKPLRGQMFLNQYNYQNITDGWIKMNTMHETYPGHHVQFIRAAIDPTPETVK